METTSIPRNYLLQYLAAASGTLAIVTDGMHYGWPSPSLPKLLNASNSSLSLTEDQGSWMAVMPLIGAIVGAIFAATIVDCLGRKSTIIATAIPFFITWIMVGYAKSIIVLFIARFIAGVADGVTFTVIPMYIGEISDPNIRGFLGSGCSVMWIFGFLLINFIGSYLSISVTALVSSIIPVILFITFIWMPESPYYLLMKGKIEEARSSLERLNRTKDVDEDFERLQQSVESQNHVSKAGKFYELFTIKSNRKAVFIIAGLRGFQQFSGTTAITFYAQEIFHLAGDDMSPEVASTIYFLVQLILTIISSIIVDKAGRKPLLIISMSGAAVALFLEGTFFFIKSQTYIDTSSFSILPVVFLIGFIIMFSLGMQSIPILLLGELFPTSVKAFALCLADIYFSIVATIASKFLQIMKDKYDIFCVFYGFTFFSVIGLIFIILFVPETKGKTLEDIQAILKGTNCDKVELERTHTIINTKTEIAKL